MYTEQDTLCAQAVRKRRLLLAFSVLALALVVLVCGLITRVKPIATFGTALIACAFYFVLEYKAMPHVRYCRYLADIENGLSHDTEARFVRMGEAPRLKDGVMFYDFVARIGDEEDDERLFYYDAEKAPPALQQDQPLHITSFGNYITDIRQQ